MRFKLFDPYELHPRIQKEFPDVITGMLWETTEKKYHLPRVRRISQFLEKQKADSGTNTDKFSLLRKRKFASAGASMGSFKSFQMALIFLVPPCVLRHIIIIPNLWVLLLFPLHRSWPQARDVEWLVQDPIVSFVCLL